MVRTKANGWVVEQMAWPHDVSGLGCDYPWHYRAMNLSADRSD